MGKANRAKTNKSRSVVKKEREWFPIITTISVLVVVAVVGAIAIFGNVAESAPAKSPASASINDETGAIAIGDGPTIIDEYIDPLCPACNIWNTKASAPIADLVKRDLATLNIYPISILDNYSQGSKYSTRASSATYCVAEASPDAAYAYVQALFKNQPSEGTKGMSDKRLIELATEVGAPEAAECITNGDYKDFVTEITKKTPVEPGASGISTPTIVVDGEFISPSEDPAAIVALAEAK